MSAPPPRHDPSTPLRERTQSQNNSLAIRIVPYSPPRPDLEDRAPSQASSHIHPHAPRDGDRSRRSSGTASSTVRSSGGTKRSSGRTGEKGRGDFHAWPGSALSSSSDASLPLAGAQEERVSGPKLLASPSLVPGPGGPTVPALRSPSEVSTNIPSINALSPRDDTSVPDYTCNSPTSTAPTAWSPAPPTTPTAQRPLSRRANVVALHPDKTFSLVRLPGSRSDSSRSLRSPPLTNSSRTSSAQDRPSLGSWTDDHNDSALTGSTNQSYLADPGISAPHAEYPPSPEPSSASAAPLPADPTSSSPWNYRFVGGLRKVPQTPNLKIKAAQYAAAPASSAPAPDSPLAPLREDASTQDEESVLRKTVSPKTSFGSVASAQTASTTSETTNYKIYGPESSLLQQSADSLALPSSSNGNWEALGTSSPAAPFTSSPPETSHSDQNFVLHGGPSPSSSLATVPRQPRPTYSQESLLVLPLRPVKKRSNEKFGYYKQRSRENLRARAGSLHSLKSISSIITTQDPTTAFFAAPVILDFGASTSRGARRGDPSSSGTFRGQWAPGPASQPAFPQRPPVPMLPEEPHQWSSQLSTVMSESEDGSAALSRSVSPLSTTGAAGHHRRRSSNGWGSSLHSRQVLSISSSLAAQLEEGSSGSDSVDKPLPSHLRGLPSQLRMVRDQDEHGDGLADLREHPSRTGLSAFFYSSNSSSRGLHSSGSSRSNSLTSSLPTWARVYYGSDEHRFFGAPSFMSLSDDGGSRPGSSAQPNGESLGLDRFPMNIHNPRRRAQEVPRPPAAGRSFSDSTDMQITQAPPLGYDYGAFRSLRRKTSSIWSPHLRTDRRASRYSVWDPPSVTWSTDTGILGKRNAQIVLFIVGFIFPFAWMIGALLPLPASPKLDMLESGDGSQSQFSRSQTEFRYQTHIVDETRYESARWWRNLNRIMSVVGLLIIGAIIALVVVGLREGWGRR
ncbi:hypothetical protein B0T18DRAFT_334660 [Schizothecium vesticola]|uniref:Serine-rich protein n=1 Tax=Schizothecium vesticola TaxID=314040 RepID=A0AA40BQ41_9PEZI|nr:hypothetical protein B0T18DRAFT_334660 [Schizothecium vesticola]